MNPRKIDEMVAEANAAIDGYRSGDLTGNVAYLHDLHEAKPTEELKAKLKRIKEPLELGLFVDAFNSAEKPPLTHAVENPAGINRADYTVFDESLAAAHDLELAAVFERWDDFPKTPVPNDASAMYVNLSEPRRPIAELQRQVGSEIKRILKKHARRTDYQPYLLSIYANLSLAGYNLEPDYVAQVVAQKLKTWPPSKNLRGVYVISPNHAAKVFEGSEAADTVPA